MSERWGTYEQHRKWWDEGVKQGTRAGSRARLPSHSTTGGALITELRFLMRLTADQRFQSALVALQEHQLINAAGNWNKNARLDARRERRNERGLADQVQFLITKHSLSIRLACACAVTDTLDELDDAGSFDAAVKLVERAWRKHHKNGVGQNP
jgi:coenzyme F420-reducing hydrogenase beta subunit